MVVELVVATVAVGWVVVVDVVVGREVVVVLVDVVVVGCELVVELVVEAVVVGGRDVVVDVVVVELVGRELVVVVDVVLDGRRPTRAGRRGRRLGDADRDDPVAGGVSDWLGALDLHLDVALAYRLVADRRNVGLDAVAWAAVQRGGNGY